MTSRNRPFVPWKCDWEAIKSKNVLACDAAAIVFAMTLGLAVVFPALSDPSSDPTLVFISQSGQIGVNRSELLKQFDVETIEIEDDPAYPCRKSRYQAARVADVLERFEIESEVDVLFIADDGYRSWIPISQLRNTGGSAPIAYLAIEDPLNGWPLRANGKRVGPFYLVWIKPKQASFSATAWPWGINTINFTSEPDGELVLPARTLAVNDPARLGYEIYRKNCKSCHSVNRSGSERMGPDLNLPLNPTEYFRDGVLRQLIRDPGSVRLISGSAMGAFGIERISDAELDQLLAYLQHMATRKAAMN